MISRKLLKLYPFSIDDYVNALESDKASNLVTHLFVSLLRLLFAVDKGYNSNPSAVVHRNWQSLLANALRMDIVCRLEYWKILYFEAYFGLAIA